MTFSFLYYRKSMKRLVYDLKYALAVIGLNTFTAEKNGDDAVVSIKPKAHSMFNITVVFTVVFGCLIKRLSLVDIVDTYGYYFFVISYLTLAVVTLVSTLSYVSKADLFVMFVNRADALDLTLNQLHIRRNNNIFFWLCTFHICAGICCVYTVMIADRSAQKKLLDLFAGFALVALRNAVFCFAILVFSFLLHRCHSINLFLEELDDDIEENQMEMIRNECNVYKKKTAQYILNIMTELLEELVNLTKLAKELFSFVIFCNVTVNVLQFAYNIVFYYFGDYSEFSLLECSLMLSFYTVQVLTLYILCFLLEQEVTNVYVTMANLNIFYSTPDLAFQKNTLLLQGLHNKVDLNLFGIIPLKGSFFLKQIDICKTIILLIVQYYRKTNVT